MTESEAIKILQRDLEIQVKNKALADGIESVKFAIQAIEKQVPMKVKNSGEGIPFEWYCPACGELLCDDGYKDTYIKYCEHCGQKLDWSDDNDDWWLY